MKASPRDEFKTKFPDMLFQSLGNSATGDKPKPNIMLPGQWEILPTCTFHWDLNMTAGKSLNGYDLNLVKN